MSKHSLLALANFNLFTNTNQEIEFSIAKDNRVQAQFSGYDKAKGFDARGIKAKSSASVGYIRLSISTIDEAGKRTYFNGALFVNDKKESEKQPDFQGSVNLDNTTDGPKLRLSAWKKKGEKAGDYLSISIQEFLTKEEVAAKAAAPADATPTPTPAAAPAPARTPAHPVARPAPQAQAEAQHEEDPFAM